MKVSFNDIINLHSSKVYHLCRSFIHDKHQTDDLFQEVMINLWKHHHKFEHKSSISTWIYRIVLNTSINFNLKEKRRKSFLENLFQSTSKIRFEIPKINEELDENKLKLKQQIAQLQDIDKSIINMYFDEMTYKEIAEVLGITTNKVGVKINRIKEKLQLKLKN